MIHKKNAHTEKVIACRDFSIGKCDLGDEMCWFNHSEMESKFKCSICKHVFDQHNNLMLHQKTEHSTTVKKCRNKSCWYGEERCWFRHDHDTDTESTENSKDQDIMEKMERMMEKFTQRLAALENGKNSDDNALEK